MTKELSYQNVGLVSVAILLGIMIFGGFALKSDFEKPKLFINETPIIKNTQVQLKSGEVYDYSYMINGTGTNITYEIIDGNDCTELRITNGMSRSAVCIKENGVDKNFDSNATLSDPTFLLFKPWMLALNEGWNWNNTIYMNFNNKLTKMTTNTYHVMRVENYRGRRMFVVRESDDNGINQYDWIDADKRILVKSIGPEYKLELISGLQFENSS